MFRELSFEEESYVSGGMEDGGGSDGSGNEGGSQDSDFGDSAPPSRDQVMNGDTHVCTDAYPGGVFCEAINPAVDRGVCVPDWGPTFFGDTVNDCVSPAVASNDR